MHIGIVKFSIRLPGNHSLKGKRKIVHSLCQKLRNTFTIAVAEVAANDDHQTAIIGISSVSNSTATLDQVIKQILSYLQNHASDYILLDFQSDIIKGF